MQGLLYEEQLSSDTSLSTGTSVKMWCIEKGRKFEKSIIIAKSGTGIVLSEKLTKIALFVFVKSVLKTGGLSALRDL